MQFIVYVLQNENSGKIYIGQTQDLEKRVARHNGLLPTKKTSFTFKNKGVWKVVYTEKYATRKEAMDREKKLKNFRGREFIKGVLKA